MSEQEMSLVQAEGAAPSEAKFSAWAEESLRRLKRADVDERKRIAEELRAEMRTAVECLVSGERSLFETMCVVEIERVYSDMGYRSTDDWIQNEVVPLIASKRKIRKLKASAREYVRLREWFGEAKPQWGVLHVLDAESERQARGKGLLTQEEYAEVSKGVAAGELSRRQLEQKLSEARDRRGRSGVRTTRGTAPGGRPPSSGVLATHEEPLAALETLEEAAKAPAEAEPEAEALATRLAAVCERGEALRSDAEPLSLVGIDGWGELESVTLDEAARRLEDVAAVLSALSRILDVSKGLGSASGALHQVDATDELSRLEREVRGRRVA